MKISFEWLKELSDIPWTPEVTADKLAELGFPVAEMQRIGVQVSKIVSGKILAVAKHPNADRLQIATVTTGKEERSIVCGAPNIAVGQVVPLALPGAQLPGGMEITVSKIRGVESAGMLCSARELGLSDEHAGIFLLPETSALGKEVKDLFGGRDVVMDVEVTPNRPDLLSHIGVARELSVLTQKPVRLPVFKFSKAVKKSACPIRIEAKDRCSFYSGKIIKGIRIKPSPDWMIRRLKNCGIRSINNVVDITNYALLEWGHPLHAFDLSKLKGPEIVVRKAKAGEKLAALDEKTYSLTPDDLVVADTQDPVALAGIMGGQPTGVTDTTTDILLESALFEPVGIRKTSQRLALRSESSFRFEKGTDRETASNASLRAVQLILELAGGTLEDEREAGQKITKPETIALREKRLEFVLGKKMAPANVTSILKRIGMKPKTSKTGWICTIPAYRHDLIEEVDLVEEVARVVGYNNFPSTLPPAMPSGVPDRFRMKSTAALADVLKGFGLTQTITSSFCSRELLEGFNVSQVQLLTLANPLSKEETVMRPLLIVNILKAGLHNQHHQRDSVMLFETGKTFLKAPKGHHESHHLAIGLFGLVQPQTWQSKKKEIDIFYLKGMLEAVNSSFSRPLQLRPASDQPFLHPHQSFDVFLRGQKSGWAGMLHPVLSAKWGFAGPAGIAEMDLDAFPLSGENAKAVPLQKVPFVERDIAVVVEKAKPWGELLTHIQKAAGELLIQAIPFDLFEGGTMGPAQKSLAFRVRLQHKDRTLTDAEINTTVENIRISLREHCGAQLR